MITGTRGDHICIFGAGIARHAALELVTKLPLQTPSSSRDHRNTIEVFFVRNMFFLHKVNLTKGLEEYVGSPRRHGSLKPWGRHSVRDRAEDRFERYHGRLLELWQVHHHCGISSELSLKFEFLGMFRTIGIHFAKIIMGWPELSDMCWRCQKIQCTKPPGSERRRDVVRRYT